MSLSHTSLLPLARLLFAASTGIFLGSTATSALSVLPALLAAPLPPHAKLAVFDLVVRRAGALLGPLFLTTAASVGYLAWCSPLRDSRVNYAAAAAAMAGSVAIQAVVGPLYKEAHRAVQAGDKSLGADALIGRVAGWNWLRVVLGCGIFGVGLLELAR